MAPLRFVTSHQVGIDRESLSPAERRVLAALGREPHQVLTKDQLIRECGLRSTRELDSIACRLAAAARASGHRAVVNVWGVGYRLLDPEAPR